MAPVAQQQTATTTTQQRTFGSAGGHNYHDDNDDDDDDDDIVDSSHDSSSEYDREEFIDDDDDDELLLAATRLVQVEPSPAAGGRTLLAAATTQGSKDDDDKSRSSSSNFDEDTVVEEEVTANELEDTAFSVELPLRRQHEQPTGIVPTDDDDDDDDDYMEIRDIEQQQTEPTTTNERRTVTSMQGEQETLLVASSDNDGGLTHNHHYYHHGVYYHGNSIGWRMLVAGCLAVTSLVFLMGFLAAFLWLHPSTERQSNSSPPTSPAAVVTVAPTATPTFRLPSAEPTFRLPSAEPTVMPSTTPRPSQAPTRNVPALGNVINSLLGSTASTTGSNSSTSRLAARERAFDWIVHDDPLQLDADDPTLSQRFLLVTVYFTATTWPSTPSQPSATTAANNVNHSWLTNVTECEWAGVACDETGQILHLNLSHFGISSVIPMELQLLTSLRVLDLSHNYFVGTIPDPLSSLLPVASTTRHRHLQQSANIFQKNESSSSTSFAPSSSSAPSASGPSISVDSLSVAPVSGPPAVDDDASYAPAALQIIDLSHNNLYGTIPSSLGRMLGLTVIDLSANALSGTIPASIVGELPDLAVLDLSNNALMGDLPILRGPTLLVVDVSGNDISGSVDESFCKGLNKNASLVVDCDKVHCSCCHICMVATSNATNSSLMPFLDLNKTTIDHVCGRVGLLQDGGSQCEAECSPLFFECCNPFDVTAGLGLLDGPLAPRNMSFMDLHVNATTAHLHCLFRTEVTNCVKFAKCHALTQQIDPAPANLHTMCSIERLENDPQGCLVLCRKVKCCHSFGSDNCLTGHFDVCLDYAPCQNLRVLDNAISSVEILPVAPPELEFNCISAEPPCREACALASCCAGAGNATCFQSNFVSCLTYLPCASDSGTMIDIPERFGKVPTLPPEAFADCSPNNIIISGNTSCNEYCKQASCCFDAVEANCFHLDPLGCLTWSTLCKSTGVVVPSIDVHNEIIPAPIAHYTVYPIPSRFDATANEVNAACGRASANGSLRCQELCDPDFSAFCRPFHATINKTGAVLGNESETFISFVESCVKYAKCQTVLEDGIDPAPASLSSFCSMEQIRKDASSCKALCGIVNCCFSSSGDNCLVQKFNTCLDYAPCQNLRALQASEAPYNATVNSTVHPTVHPIGNSSTMILPVAERSIGAQCEVGNEEDCIECQRATCCGNVGEGSCFRANFVSCLTYSSCQSLSDTVLSLPRPFEFAPMVPTGLAAVCNKRQRLSNATMLKSTGKTCEQYCSMVSCCFANGADSCFNKDPLGCLRWYSYCQLLL